MVAILLGNILATSQGLGVNKAGEEIVRAGYGNKKGWKATTEGHNKKMNF